MATFLIITGIIILIAGLYFALRTMKPVDFVVIVGIIILIITVFSILGKQLQDKNSSLKTDSIKATGEGTAFKVDVLTEKNDKLRAKIDSQVEIIDRLRKENIDASNQLLAANEKITELQKSSLKEITGGNNLPLIGFSISTNANRPFDTKTSAYANYMLYQHEVSFTLINGGKYSLKDVMFSISDPYNKPQTANRITPYNYQKQVLNWNEVGTYHNIEVKALALQSRKVVYITKFPESKGNGNYEFDIVIEWSNGLYQCHLDVIEKEGKIISEAKYYNSEGKEIDRKALEKRVYENK